jgi:hypothetical protein
MSELLKTRGRPTGGKNLVFVSILQLREKMTDAAKIPISVKFAKQVNLIDEGENPHQTTTPPKQENPAKPVVSFSISEVF